MKNKILFLIVIIIIAFVATSCVSAGGGSAPLKREVEALKVDVENLKAGRALSSQKGGGATNSEITNLRLELKSFYDSLEVASLDGNMSLGQRLDFYNQRLERLEQQAQLKPLVAPLGSASSGTGKVEVPVVGSASAEIAAPIVVPAETGLGDAPVVSTARSSFEEGKSLYDTRNYDLAILKFREHVQESPSGNQAAAAQFYIGECLSAQQKYQDAILEYQKVVQSYPKSSQVPSALLKQGAAFQGLNDNNSAKLFYQKVASQYPKSYAAGVAKERLRAL